MPAPALSVLKRLCDDGGPSVQCAVLGRDLRDAAADAHDMVAASGQRVVNMDAPRVPRRLPHVEFRRNFQF